MFVTSYSVGNKKADYSWSALVNSYIVYSS